MESALRHASTASTVFFGGFMTSGNYCRACGLPLGSGAIESSVRRVINLRLKGNGIFWREAYAEEMLQVRAQVLTGRWDERMTAKRRHLRYDRRLDWCWDPQPMSSKA